MAKVKPIPDGYHTITPHLICRDAARSIEFYKKAFGAEEVMRLGPPGGAVMHAEMRIGDSHFMIADENPQWNCKSPLALNGTPVSLHVYVNDVDKAYQRAVQAGAQPKMPVSDMFWGDRYGQVVDPSGHTWSLATHVKDMTPEEIGRAAQAAMAGGDCGSQDKQKA